MESSPDAANYQLCDLSRNNRVGAPTMCQAHELSEKDGEGLSSPRSLPALTSKFNLHQCLNNEVEEMHPIMQNLF